MTRDEYLKQYMLDIERREKREQEQQKAIDDCWTCLYDIYVVIWKQQKKNEKAISPENPLPNPQRQASFLGLESLDLNPNGAGMNWQDGINLKEANSNSPSYTNSSEIRSF